MKKRIKKKFKVKSFKKRRPINFYRMIALVFLVIIIIGAILLNLPIASRNRESLGFLNSFFTATSAVCVTGLIVKDTWTQFSMFGMVVIIVLIQIGGLGFMSIASLLILAFKRKANLNQEMAIATAFGNDDYTSAVRVQKKMLIGCFITEGTGALILFFCFLKDYGFGKSILLGIFHSISAFCNAGFDTFGFVEEGIGMNLFYNNPFVLITLALLIITGGLGFIVWDEIFTTRKVRRLSLYTKLVLFTTIFLLIIGTGLFLVIEWNNPETLGNLSVWEKILAAFFQSATTRTAGFAAMSQGGLTDGGKALSIVLMLIGGSSGSTAGGLKTVTFIVILLFLISRFRGKDTIKAFGRTIPMKQVYDALTIFTIMVSLSFVGALMISVDSNVPFIDALYETISAIATVGLTTGITPSLHILSKVILIFYMYFGRVGILTISLGFFKQDKVEEKIKYIETNLLIG